MGTAVVKLRRRRAEAKRKEVEARKFKETASQRQDTIEEKRQKKAEEEAVGARRCSVLRLHAERILCESRSGTT
jgi:hypothetical protein